MACIVHYRKPRHLSKISSKNFDQIIHKVTQISLSLSELFGVESSTLFGVSFEHGPPCRSARRRPKVGVGSIPHNPTAPGAEPSLAVRCPSCRYPVSNGATMGRAVPTVWADGAGA